MNTDLITADPSREIHGMDKDTLCRDFLSAQSTNCQSAEVWHNLAHRYYALLANVNYAYCLRRAAALEIGGKYDG